MELNHGKFENIHLPDCDKSMHQNIRRFKTRNSTTDAKHCPLLFSKRFLVCVLLFVWNIITWIIRNNMNVAVVEMISNKTIVLQGNLSVTQPPEFHWSSKRIGLVLGLIHCGGLLSFTSGFLISKLGGSMSCALSLMVCGTTTLLHPACLRLHFFLFLPCRIITGIFHGFYMSSFFEVFSRWIPKNERSKMMTFCYSGLYIGAVIVYPVCGFIATEWGWPMVFYTVGSVCTAMTFLCMALLKNDPNHDETISKRELFYINNGIQTNLIEKQVVNPYKSILTSPSIWALCTANIATNCGLTFLLDCLPIFIKDITGKNTADVGLFSCIPSFVTLFMFFFTGAFIVYWKNNTKISSTRMHKILMGVAIISQIFLFLGLTLVSNFTTILLVMVAIRLFTPFNILIVQLITIEIAPGYSGMVSGLVTFCGSFISISTQSIIGFMTINHTREEWNRCFIIISGLLTISIIVFLVYGSSEPEAWSLPTKHQEKGNLNESMKLTEK